MTNGDKIRSMTDVELANFLATDAVIACVHCKGDLIHVVKGISVRKRMRLVYSVNGWAKNGNRGDGLLNNTNKICGGYCGVSCVDGSCPIANADTYEEYGMDVIRRCEDCWMYRGCADCMFEGSELCERNEILQTVIGLGA